MALNTPHIHDDAEPTVKLTLLQGFWKEMERVWKNQPVKGPLPQVSDEQFKRQIVPVKPALYLMNAPAPEDFGRFFQNYYPEGALCTVTALPFTKNCADVPELQQQGRLKNPADFRHFFYVLMTDPATGLTTGFNDRPGHFLEMLPDRLKKSLDEGGTSFKISYPSKDPDTNRQWLAGQMGEAMENFKKFVNEELAN